jgi:uncharacterized membrane protein YbhN (UPF0104 family)
VVVAVALNSKSLFAQLGDVGHPNLVWLAAALAAEAMSLLAYVTMVRELLLLGGVRAPVLALMRPTLAGIAMGASLPGGVGASNVYWYRQLRRHGADRGLSLLTITATSVAGALSLGALLVVGIALAGDAGPLSDARVWVLRIVAVAIVIRLAFARRLGRRLTRVMRRIAPDVEPKRRVRSRRLRIVMVLAYSNWLLDCAALFASLQADHASVPARSVILVYALSQLVANLALLPGGGGTVELSIVAGFSTFVGHSATLLAGVLLYRFVNCWGLIPVGWLAVVLDPARRRSRTVAVDAVDARLAA